MRTDGRDWVAALSAELDGQRALLDGLLDRCEADDSISWLVIGCSLARGAADRLSDLDMAIGVTGEEGEEFATAAARVHQAADELGGLVDSYRHQIPELRQAHERIFAQYASGAQLDLVVFPASMPFSSMRGIVVLYDAGGQPGAEAGQRAAGRALAAQLSQAGHDLRPDWRAALPEAMGRYVTAQLAALPPVAA